jgi:hypothetical protein
MKMEVTSAQSSKVLALRLAKTIAFDWVGGIGESAIGTRIQDGGGSCGNSFPCVPRNLFPGRWFPPQTRPETGLQSSKPPSKMKTKQLLTLAALLGTCGFASAQEKPKRPDRPQREVPAAILEKFDADKDGKLSPDERKAMMAEREAAMLAKYDADKDGKLSPEERKTMREEMEARRKALLEKYDADKDGKLSPEEIKTARAAGEEMPMGPGPGDRKAPRGPKGPGGKKGPGAPDAPTAE